MFSFKANPDKAKRATIKYSALVFYCILMSPHYLRAQSILPEIFRLKDAPYFISLPSGFPTVPIEGADSLDIRRYALEKQNWIQKNPDLYLKIAERPSLYTPAEQDSIRARKEEEMRIRNTLPIRK